MSGYEVLKQLRVSKVGTPILILSGLAAIEDKVKGLGFGADDYMTKPFHKDELVARIHAVVRRRTYPPDMCKFEWRIFDAQGAMPNPSFTPANFWLTSTPRRWKWAASACI